MKTRTENLASDWGLCFVEITEGMNGYPKNLYKAVEGFDTFEDADAFAREVNGEVVLLTRRDGHQFWTNNGRQFEGLERAKFIDEENEVLFTDVDEFEDWARRKLEAMIGEGDNIYDIKNESAKMCDIADDIYAMDEDTEICVVDRGDLDYDVVPQYMTMVHDDDVTTYAIAVVDYETDEDKTNEEKED